MDTASSDENVGGRVERSWQMDDGRAMGRSCCWLETFNFQAQIGELLFALPLELVVFCWVRSQEFPG